MSSNTVVKEEIFQCDDQDESLDDVTDLISRAEAIIQENRERIRRNKRQNAERIREEAIAVLQECSPVILSEEPTEESPCTNEEQRSSDAAQEPSVDTCTRTDNDDDVIFVACVQPPNRAPLIDLSTPDKTTSEQLKTHRRRRGRPQNSLTDDIIAGNDIPTTTANTASNPNRCTFNTNTSRDMNNAANGPGQRTKLNITCSICLETYKKPNSTICGHVFCENCIKAAIAASNKCPLCNRKLSHRGFHPLFL